MICCIYGLYALVLGRIFVDREEVRPVKATYRNRVLQSFIDEECWHFFRFCRTELVHPIVLCEIPEVVCKNGTECSGEHAFCLMLFRLAYPCRPLELHDVFGRDYSQTSRIFKWSIDFMNEKYKHKVKGTCPGTQSGLICTIRL